MKNHNLSREFKILSLGLGFGVLLSGSSVWASPLAQLDRNGLKVAITEEGGSIVVQVAPASAGHSTVFALGEPGRLVIDIPGKHFQRTEVLAIKGSELVQSLRLGSHADKARIVVDLAGSGEPKFSVKDAAKGIRIVVGEGHEVAAHKEPPVVHSPAPKQREPVAPAMEKEEAKAAVPAKVSAPTLAPMIPTAVPTYQPTIAPTAIRPTAAPTATGLAAAPTATGLAAAPAATRPMPTAAPVVQHKELPLQKAEPAGLENTKIVMKGNEAVGSAVAEQEAKAPSTSGQMLQSILFDKNPDDGQPVVRLKFSNRPRFLMTKSSERAYRLVVPDISLAGEQLALPFFPPQDFKGFTVVRAEAKAKDVEIMIGVERGGRITPTTKDNEVWIQLAPQ